MKKIIIFLVFILLTNVLISQNLNLLIAKGEYNKVCISYSKNKGAISKENKILYAIAHKMLNKHKIALQLFNEVLKEDPYNQVCLSNCGDIYMDLQLLDKAVDCFTILAHKNKNDIFINYNLAQCYYQNANYKGAHMVYKNLIKLDSLNSVYHYNKGIVEEKLNKKLESINSFNRAYKLNSNDMRSLKKICAFYIDIKLTHIVERILKDKEFQKDSNKQLIANAYNKTLLAILTKISLAKKDFLSAQKLLEKTIYLEFGGPVTKKNLGVCYFKTQNYHECLNTFRELIMLSKDYKEDPTINFYQALSYKELQNTDKAVYHLKIALRKSIPDAVSITHMHLGSIYNDKREFKLAIEHYQKALEFKPNNSEALMQIATTYEEFGNNKKSALTYYKKLLRSRTARKKDIAYAKVRIARINEYLHMNK